MPLIELLVAIPYSSPPSCPKRVFLGGGGELCTLWFLTQTSTWWEAIMPLKIGGFGTGGGREGERAAPMMGSLGGRRGICMSDERKRGQGETDARLRGKG